MSDTGERDLGNLEPAVSLLGPTFEEHRETSYAIASIRILVSWQLLRRPRMRPKNRKVHVTKISPTFALRS